MDEFTFLWEHRSKMVTTLNVVSRNRWVQRNLPAALLALVLVAVGGYQSFCDNGSAVFSAGNGSIPLSKFIDDNQTRYKAVLARSRAWLDKLTVDPVDLRKHGVKGKGMLVLILDAYVRLYRIADSEDRVKIIARCRNLAAPTYQPEFHDMAKIDDHQFHQDATSYLRAAYLLDKFHLDTTLYRRKILEILPRLNAQLPSRGFHQKMVFAWYYHHFGIPYPLPETHSHKEGIIAMRADPAAILGLDIYNLTHEVFVPYDYGDNLKVTPFSTCDIEYLRQTLPILVSNGIQCKDQDITAELLSCLTCLGIEDSQEYRSGLLFLLDSQNADGSYGTFEKYPTKLGDRVEAIHYLHTTAVVIDALTIAFMDRSLSPPR